MLKEMKLVNKLNTTLMLAEAREAPAAIARQLAMSQNEYREFAKTINEFSPTAALTIARGSSDHAAHFMAYLIMARMARLVTSLPMSLITLNNTQIDCKGLLSMAFSQSGQSPDLIAPMQYFTANGAGNSVLARL